MKKLLPLLLCCLLILTSCAAPSLLPSPEEDEDVLSILEEFAHALEHSQDVSEESGREPSLPGLEPVAAYRPTGTLTMEETIAAYFEQMYKSYTSMDYIDISSIMDMDMVACQNNRTWQRMLAQRRRLIKENNLCYVETSQFPYKINYIDPGDSIYNPGAVPGETYVYFVITGQSGKAYPPMFALNAQHALRLKKEGGTWKITFHFFPGSARKFSNNNGLSLPSDQVALQRLKEEFAAPSASSPPDLEIPDTAIPYSSAHAAQYAQIYAEARNPTFYRISDTIGNCANFTSQCIWYGFKNGTDDDDLKIMTSSWYASGGGGSPAWENVNNFWAYATGGYEMGSVQLSGVRSMQPGDLIQYQNVGYNNRFNHSMILVDQSKLIFAQNSPHCFVYYSDLAGTQNRFLRPVYLDVGDLSAETSGESA